MICTICTLKKWGRWGHKGRKNELGWDSNLKGGQRGALLCPWRASAVCTSISKYTMHLSCSFRDKQQAGYEHWTVGIVGIGLMAQIAKLLEKTRVARGLEESNDVVIGGGHFSLPHLCVILWLA